MTLLLFLYLQTFLQAPASGLQLVFSNIQKPQGVIYVAVYDSPSTYMDATKVRAKRVLTVSERGTITCNLAELGPGTYAISCFHDVNGNGKLDTNFLGIPSEPYGASNNARPKFRAANWEETKFTLSKGGGTEQIRLEKW